MKEATHYVASLRSKRLRITRQVAGSALRWLSLCGLLVSAGGCAFATTPIRLQVVDADSGRPLPGVRPVEEDILHNEPLGPQQSWEHVWPATDSRGMTKRDVPLGLVNGIDIEAEGYQLARINAAWEKSGWGRLIENVVDVETPAKKFGYGDGPIVRHSTKDVVVIRLYPIKPADP